MVKMKHADIIGSILLLAFCAAAWAGTKDFTESAALLPRITIGLIALLSVVQLIRVMMRPSEKTVSFKMRKILTLLALTFAYAILMPIIGFYVATILYIGGSMYIYGVRKKAVLLGVPVGFCIFAALCFVKFLSLRLPKPFFM